VTSHRYIIAGLVLFITVMVSLSLCKSSNPSPLSKKKRSLKIVSDSLESRIIPFLSAPNKRLSSHHWAYDSVNNQMVYKFDSVDDGEWKINFQSLVGQNYSRTISVKTDTSVFVSKSDFPQVLQMDPDSLDITDLKKGEQLTVSVYMSGCFAQSLEKLIVTKEVNSYLVRFFSTDRLIYDVEREVNNYKFDSVYIQKLEHFQNAVRKFIRQKSFAYCTTNYTYYISKGNKSYKFFDGNCDTVIPYEILAGPIFDDLSSSQ